MSLLKPVSPSKSSSKGRLTPVKKRRSRSNNFLLPKNVQDATGKQSVSGSEYFDLKRSSNNFADFTSSRSSSRESSSSPRSSTPPLSSTKEGSSSGFGNNSNREVFIDDNNRDRLNTLLNIFEKNGRDVGALREQFGLSDGPTDIVATSQGSRRAEENLEAEIVEQQSFNLQPTALDGLDDVLSIGQQTQRLLAQRGDQLEDRYENRVDDINRSADEEMRLLEDRQERETAGFQTGLARIGGYLGNDNASMGALVSLRRDHEIEIATKEGQRQEALNTAYEAYVDGNFEVAQLELQNAKAMATSIKEAKNQYFTQSLQLAQEQRARDEQAYSRAKDEKEWGYKVANKELDLAMESDGEISTDTILEMSRSLGISPQVIEQAIEAKQNTRALLKEDRIFNRDIQLINALKGVPKGTYVTIGGVSYEGMDAPTYSGGSGGGGGSYSGGDTGYTSGWDYGRDVSANDIGMSGNKLKGDLLENTGLNATEAGTIVSSHEAMQKELKKTVAADMASSYKRKFFKSKKGELKNARSSFQSSLDEAYNSGGSYQLSDGTSIPMTESNYNYIKKVSNNDKIGEIVIKNGRAK